MINQGICQDIIVRSELRKCQPLPFRCRSRRPRHDGERTGGGLRMDKSWVVVDGWPERLRMFENGINRRMDLMERGHLCLSINR